MTLKCPQLKSQLQVIKSLFSNYCLELEKAKVSHEFEQVERALVLKTELEIKIKELKKQLYPLENLEQENLERQYNKQIEILTSSGILENLVSGELGIKINGQEYPVPTLDNVLKRLRQNPEFLDKKVSQGFQKLLIVPFGLDIQTLVEKYKQVLLKHYNNQTLLDSEENLLNLDTANPVRIWGGYQNEPLVYFPQQFDKDNHQGKTKDQLEPWQVLLVEDMIDLPAQGEAKTINQRKQLEANQAPNYYLEQILREGEQGLTLEAWLLLAITYLEEQNKQIDNWLGKGMASYLPGAYFPQSAKVLFAYWSRVYRGANLDSHDADSSGSYNAVRSSVAI